jgi:hypothetical protein
MAEPAPHFPSHENCGHARSPIVSLL